LNHSVDMHNLSLGMCHLVNAYEVKAGIDVIASNTVWSMPERLECEVLQKARYINTLTFTFTFKGVRRIRKRKWRQKLDKCTYPVRGLSSSISIAYEGDRWETEGLRLCSV